MHLRCGAIYNGYLTANLQLNLIFVNRSAFVKVN